MENGGNIEIQRNVMEETVIGMEQKESFLNQVKAKKTTKDSLFRDLFENPTYSTTIPVSPQPLPDPSLHFQQDAHYGGSQYKQNRV